MPPETIFDGLGRYRYFNFTLMPYGSARRRMIEQYLLSAEPEKAYLPINKKYCLILKTDPDLKRMIKQGKLRMEKRWNSKKCTYSVLVLNK